ncbi:hypothetical protein HYU10_04325 [Candidatus Woesearchaeota archaeon]|nr:hypothetical protein [Candidatus Woesearchaeota archaeon]MBI2130968.1 hypothetical protein [Candidatus Woesearchaeota archaeon]MBI2660834.1 hypothetical protein [Candidatus Woesearchaeota archaeon]
MTKLKPNIVALSLGLTFLIVSLICLILIAVFPIGMMARSVNYMAHGIDISGIAMKTFTAGSVIIGFIEVFLLGAIIGYIFASVYNWTQERF